MKIDVERRASGERNRGDIPLAKGVVDGSNGRYYGLGR